jgi:DnaJ homolog subfamily C member 1
MQSLTADIGTGYYYSRFRPGLGTVLTFLVMVTSLMQHVVQRLNRTRDIARIERIVQQARRAAWGPKMVPLSGPRKVKISLGATPMMASDNDESDYDERSASSGKTIPVLVDGDQVYLVSLLYPGGGVAVLTDFPVQF